MFTLTRSSKLFGYKAPSQVLEALILSSYTAHLDLSFSIPQLSCITANVYLACKVHLTVRITSFAVHNLYRKHQSTIWSLMFIIHCSQTAITLFSKFPPIRVSNTRTHNQGIAKQLSPIDYPIQLSRR